VIQTVYMRRTEMVNGKLDNVEFDSIRTSRIRGRK